MNQSEVLRFSRLLRSEQEVQCRQQQQLFLSHLEVPAHLLLQVVRVVLQALSEPCHAVADLQQLHRVTVVIPAGCDVLHNTQKVM